MLGGERDALSLIFEKLVGGESWKARNAFEALCFQDWANKGLDEEFVAVFAEDFGWVVEQVWLAIVFLGKHNFDYAFYWWHFFKSLS